MTHTSETNLLPRLSMALVSCGLLCALMSPAQAQISDAEARAPIAASDARAIVAEVTMVIGVARIAGADGATRKVERNGTNPGGRQN